MERVGALLQSLSGTEVLRRRVAEARGLAGWPGIVGSHLAQRTRAVGLAGGRLFVVCHGSALRQELAFHKREILRRFREVAGRGVNARELVLLETDANLSSLVREAEEQGARRAAAATRTTREKEPAEGSTARAAEERVPGPAQDATDEEPPSVRVRIAAAYPRFDGAAYREEMRRIAEGD